MVKRKEVLEQAGNLISSKRAKIYGDAKHLDSWVDIVGYAALAGEDDEWNEDDG